MTTCTKTKTSLTPVPLPPKSRQFPGGFRRTRVLTASTPARSPLWPIHLIVTVTNIRTITIITVVWKTPAMMQLGVQTGPIIPATTDRIISTAITTTTAASVQFETVHSAAPNDTVFEPTRLADVFECVRVCVSVFECV